MKSVQGKTVLVTGAAMGLGKLFATKAVTEGAAAVVLWDINEAALVETVEELQAAGGNIHAYVVDVSDAEAIGAASALVLDEVGPVDVLFNNAGIVRGNTYFWETEDVAQIQQTMAINSVAPMLITREFLPGMIGKDSECRIVNIASSAGLVSNPRMAVYAASKWAAIGWSDSVRLELEQAGYDHIKVTTVCPDVHQHRHVRRREERAPDPDARAGGGRRRRMERDAARRTVPADPVDGQTEQGARRDSAGRHP